MDSLSTSVSYSETAMDIIINNDCKEDVYLFDSYLTDENTSDYLHLYDSDSDICYLSFLPLIPYLGGMKPDRYRIGRNVINKGFYSYHFITISAQDSVKICIPLSAFQHDHYMKYVDVSQYSKFDKGIQFWDSPGPTTKRYLVRLAIYEDVGILLDHDAYATKEYEYNNQALSYSVLTIPVDSTIFHQEIIETDTDLAFGDSLFPIPSYSQKQYKLHRRRFRELMTRTRCDTLIGKKQLFALLSSSYDVIGIKNDNHCKLLYYDHHGHHQCYCLPLDYLNVSDLFEPIDVQDVVMEHDNTPSYSYFVRFTVDGSIDAEFDENLRIKEGFTNQLRQPLDDAFSSLEQTNQAFIDRCLLNYAMINPDTRLGADIKRRHMLAQWWFNDNYNIGIVSDSTTGVADTLLWHNYSANRRQKMQVIIHKDTLLIITDQQQLYHFGPSVVSIRNNRDNDTDYTANNNLSISFQIKRFICNEHRNIIVRKFRK